MQEAFRGVSCRSKTGVLLAGDDCVFGVKVEDPEQVLNEERVALPTGTPPRFDNPNFTQRVEVPNDDLRRVVRVLADRRGKNGPRIAFNSGGDGVGFVACEDGLELQAIVDEVLDRGPN